MKRDSASMSVKKNDCYKMIVFFETLIELQDYHIKGGHVLTDEEKKERAEAERIKKHYERLFDNYNY